MRKSIKLSRRCWIDYIKNWTLPCGVEVVKGKEYIVFRIKVYNKVMRLRGLLGKEDNDRKCGKFEGGFE